MSIRNTNLIWTGKIIKYKKKCIWKIELSDYRQIQNKSEFKLNLNLNCLEIICVKRIFFFLLLFRVDFKTNFWIMYLFFTWYINSTPNNLRAFFFLHKQFTLFINVVFWNIYPFFFIFWSLTVFMLFANIKGWVAYIFKY